MTNIFKKFNLTKTDSAPYLGGEKAPRPYRDWYVMVVVSVVVLWGMIVVYGYVVLKITDHQALSDDVLIEKSFSKIKPDDLKKIATKIEEKEANFLELVASSTPAVDPSL